MKGQAAAWSTPNAHDGRRPTDEHSTQGRNLAREASFWRTPDLGGGSSLNGSGTKRNPLLAEQAKLWCTPMSRDRKDGAPTDAVPTNGHLFRQAPRMQMAGENGSQPVVLNPLFVETLMGFPLGWTDCGASAMPSSPHKPSSPSIDSQGE